MIRLPIGKKIRCKTCNKVILAYKKSSYSKEEILSAIRRHYKKHHPERFKKFAKKAVATKKERGIIKHHSKARYISFRTKDGRTVRFRVRRK